MHPHYVIFFYVGCSGHSDMGLYEVKVANYPAGGAVTDVNTKKEVVLYQEG